MLESIKQAFKFALLVKPETHLGALLVLKSPCELIDQSRENHLHNLCNAKHTGTLKWFNIYLDAVVDVRVPPFRALCFCLPWCQNPVVVRTVVESFLNPLEPSIKYFDFLNFRL